MEQWIAFDRSFISIAIPHINCKIYNMKKKQRVLKLAVDDEEKELEFELDYLSSLTFEERLKMMREKSREMLKQMIDHGHRSPFEIIKRT